MHAREPPRWPATGRAGAPMPRMIPDPWRNQMIPDPWRNERPRGLRAMAVCWRRAPRLRPRCSASPGHRGDHPRHRPEVGRPQAPPAVYLHRRPERGPDHRPGRQGRRRRLEHGDAESVEQRREKQRRGHGGYGGYERVGAVVRGGHRRTRGAHDGQRDSVTSPAMAATEAGERVRRCAWPLAYPAPARWVPRSHTTNRVSPRAAHERHAVEGVLPSGVTGRP